MQANRLWNQYPEATFFFPAEVQSELSTNQHHIRRSFQRDLDRVLETPT